MEEDDTSENENKKRRIDFNDIDVYGDMDAIDINDPEQVRKYSEAVFKNAPEKPETSTADSEYDATPPDLEEDFETWRVQTDVPMDLKAEDMVIPDDNYKDVNWE